MHGGDHPELARPEVIPADDATFVEWAYRVVLQREPDPGGVEHWTRFLSDGGWRKTVVQAMVGGEEFRTLGTEPLQLRLHLARQAWIQALPVADDLIDIGGTSPLEPQGALRQMGWRGEPTRLRIVDLPPDDQYHGRPVYSQEEPHQTPWGGRVEYVHSRAEDLPGSDLLEGGRIDGFFMGQAIEHVEVDAVPDLLRWIRANLDPGGWFAFDTPNRAVTELQVPGSFIDPDHTIEYRAGQIEELLERAGFRVASRAGMLPFPDSVARGAWDPEETFRLPLLGEDPSVGYCLAYVAVPA